MGTGIRRFAHPTSVHLIYSCSLVLPSLLSGAKPLAKTRLYCPGLAMAASMVVRDPILGTAEPIVTPASPGGREQGTGNGEQETGEDLGARPSAAMPASTLPNLEGTENREQGIGESTDRLPSSTTPTGLPPDSTLTSPSETVDVGATTPAEPPFLLSKIDIVDSTVLVKEEVEKILQSSSESGEPEETEGSEEKSQFTGIKVTERPGENNRTIWSIEFDERETTVEELQSIADAVTQFYLTQDHDWVAATAETQHQVF